MGDTPLQLTLSVFELLALLSGAFLLVRMVASPARRAALVQNRHLAPWPITGVEVALLLLLIFLLAITGQNLAALLFAGAIKSSADRAGLEVAVYGFGFHAVALLGWPVFRLFRHRLYADYGAPPPASTLPEPDRVPWLQAGRNGVATVLMALPLLTLAALGWSALLRVVGLPEAPQDLIAIFGQARSPVVIAAMLGVACVAAPVNEEMIFRRGIFRYCRQRFGRTAAFAVSALSFAALHQNWFSFFPLAVFGLVLAAAYEVTGDIRVPIIAHGLFNLNTVLYILSGLPQ